MRAAIQSRPSTAHSSPWVAGLWSYAPLVAALALRLASAPTANLSYLALAAYAIFGPANAIRALAFSWLFTMFNPGLAPDASFASIGRYAVLFAAAFSTLIHSNFLTRCPRLRPFTLSTLLVGLFLIAHSVMLSPIADVSILKAISWTIAMATSISAWSGLSEWRKRQLSKQIFFGLVAILVISLPLAATPLGYLRNGSGFQGILNHPQAFGPTMALLGAWAASRMFGELKPAWWLVGLTGACLIVVLMTEARTAGIAMACGFTLSLLAAPGFAGSSIVRMVPGVRSIRIWTVVLLTLVGGLVMAPQIADTVQHYVTKSGRVSGDSLTELYETSRGRLINTMLNNFMENPLTGIGFGIASEPALMEVKRDSVFGLPTGASVEKGVTPLMVLEEVGIFGAVFVSIWLLGLLRSAARSGLAPFAVCLTVLLINMGEAIFFSAGGMGLLPMILIGWAYAGGLSPSRMHRA